MRRHPSKAPRSSDLPELNENQRAALRRLQELLAQIPDRRMPGKVLFPIDCILLIAFCAMLADCDHYTEMALFAQTRADWLATFMDLPGTPSHDVFRNVFSALQPAALLDLMARWTGSLTGAHVIIDGKVLRGTNQGRARKAPALLLLRAWACQSGLSLGQLPCGDKTCEAAVLPQLIESLHLNGAIVSIDAMGTHPDTARALHEQGADWLLALKANQPQALAEVQAHFQTFAPAAELGPAAAMPAPPPAHQRSTTLELSHGRSEQRITTTTVAHPWFSRAWKWHGLQSITEVRRRTSRAGAATELSEEVHYYLSSLPPDATLLAATIRRHWAVENTCHHVLDVTFHEDHCQVQHAHAAQNLSLMREMAAKTIRDYPLKGSIASKRKRACLDPNFTLRLLLSAIDSIFQA